MSADIACPAAARTARMRPAGLLEGVPLDDDPALIARDALTHLARSVPVSVTSERDRGRQVASCPPAGGAPCDRSP